MRRRISQFLLSAFFVLTLASVGFTQENYKIRIKVSGLQDSISYLASYYGDKVVSKDTSENKNNTITFKGEENLPGGIYMLISQDKKKLMEFIIDKDRKFTIKTDTSDYIKNARAIRSAGNELFFDYIRYTDENHKMIKKYRKLINSDSTDQDSISIYREMIEKINKSVIDYKLSFIKDNPEHILSSVFLMIKDPELPEEQLNDTIKADPNKKYYHYRNHFWDGISFSDERLLQTPVFHKKLNTYFKDVIRQHPDTIIREIDHIFELSSPSKEMFTYLFWYFIENFDGSEIMGHDKIFVHIAMNYLDNDKIIEISESVRENIRERAKKIEPLLLNKEAPNLILLDTNNQFTSFLRINADFTVILFWDYDCGVCKKEINELKSFTDTTKIDIRVFAVCTDTNLAKWKKYVKKEKLNWMHVNGTRSVTRDYHNLYDIYGTPVIYLLNRKKQIIAKRITAGQLVPFLQHYISKHEDYQIN